MNDLKSLTDKELEQLAFDIWCEQMERDSLKTKGLSGYEVFDMLDERTVI